MNKKRVLIILLVLTIMIIAFKSYISLNTIYFGNFSKAIVIGKKVIKKDENRRIILKKVNAYKDDKIIDGYIKSEKVDIGYNYYLESNKNKKIDMKELIASGTMIKLDIPSSSNVDVLKNENTISKINNLLDLNLDDSELFDYKKITFDIDNDSEDEEVIYVNYLEDNYSKTNIFINDNSIIKVFEYKRDITNKIASYKTFKLSNIIDLNNDKNYEIIISRVDSDSQPPYYDIYSYKNGKVKEIK